MTSFSTKNVNISTETSHSDCRTKHSASKNGNINRSTCANLTKNGKNTELNCKTVTKKPSSDLEASNGIVNNTFIAPDSETRVLKADGFISAGIKGNSFATRRRRNKVKNVSNVAVVLKRFIPDFTNLPNSLNESSVQLVKPSKIRKEICKENVNFSVPLEASTDSVPRRTAVGCLRRIRENAKPLANVDFSNITSMNASFPSISKSKEHFNSKSVPAIFSVISKENSSCRIRGRRCSTPIQQRSLIDFVDEPNLSLIPPPSSRSAQTLSKSVSTRASVPQILPVQVPARGNSYTTENVNSSRSSARAPESVSFVANVFAPKDKSPEIVPNAEQRKSPMKRRSVPIGKLRKPIFPSFSPFCNGRFYKFLICKMESKYGIKTNKMVVKVAQKISDVVEDVKSMNRDYDVNVRRLKVFLYCKNVIRTEYDFHCFCLKFLPPFFVSKAVPITQPGKRIHVSWNVDSLFNFVEY